MSVNFSLEETFSLLLDSLKYDMMLAILICAVAILLTCFLNERRGIAITIFANSIILFLIGRYYIGDLIRFEFSDPLNNIYFYLFNSLIFIVLYDVQAVLHRLDKYDYVFNSIFFIFIVYSLFMTDYLYNATEIVIINIYPMIKFGNILLLIYYLTILTKLGYHVILKKTSKRSGRL